MSVHMIYYKDGGAKFMRPIHSREEYLKLRDSEEQQSVVRAVRSGNAQLKSRLIQMNYSCLPNEDGSLKGSRTASKSVGMDIDFVAPDGLSAEEKKAWLKERMQGVPELVLGKKEELGLLMLERSATKGYHLVFKRKPELSQEENLKWASELLGVKFDEKAKDITRVFYTTTASGEDLIYFDDELFDNSGERLEVRGERLDNSGERLEVRGESNNHSDNHNSQLSTLNSQLYPNDYHGISFTDILRKYWELFNDGKLPMKGDRDTLTYQLACDLRHICDRDADWLDQVIPECVAGQVGGDALQVEAGAASVEVSIRYQGLWWYDDHTTTHAEEIAAIGEAAHEECALVLQASCGDRHLPCFSCPPAWGEVPLLGQCGA